MRCEDASGRVSRRDLAKLLFFPSHTLAVESCCLAWHGLRAPEVEISQSDESRSVCYSYKKAAAGGAFHALEEETGRAWFVAAS